MSDINQDVLKLLKGGLLLSAVQIELQLELRPHPKQKEVRNAIDMLRDQGEPIWNETGKGFFWRNDRTVQSVGNRSRWKRGYSS